MIIYIYLYFMYIALISICIVMNPAFFFWKCLGEIDGENTRLALHLLAPPFSSAIFTWNKRIQFRKEKLVWTSFPNREKGDTNASTHFSW